MTAVAVGGGVRGEGHGAIHRAGTERCGRRGSPGLWEGARQGRWVVSGGAAGRLTGPVPQCRNTDDAVQLWMVFGSPSRHVHCLTAHSEVLLGRTAVHWALCESRGLQDAVVCL